GGRAVHAGGQRGREEPSVHRVLRAGGGPCDRNPLQGRHRARRAVPPRARQVAAAPDGDHGRGAGPGTPCGRTYPRAGRRAADGRAQDRRDSSRAWLLIDSHPSPSHVARETARPDRDIDLTRAALIISRSEYPNLDVDAYVAKMATLADGVMAARETDPLGRLHRVREYLFEEQGFAGNSDNYFDPRNSYLN